MSDFDTARDGGLTTDQIAAGCMDAGGADTATRDSATQAPGQQEYAAEGQLPPSSGGEAMSGAGGEAMSGAGGEARPQLLEADELQSVVGRWREIQAQFVDDPGGAVREADALVADLMQRLARMFAAERTDLESRLAGSDGRSTEDLRQGLQRYRSFFERLLAA